MLWAGFLFGLVGGFHCVGMCGAIALALPGAGGASWRYVAGRVLYNLGRVTTYSLLGAATGVLGQGLRLAGWQQSLSLLSGALILVLVVTPEHWLGRAAAFFVLDVVLARVKRRLLYFYQQPSLGALYATGLLNGLLPCGLVYLALAGALSATGVAGAAAYMALFGLGTLPLMLVFSLTGQLVPTAWRLRMRRAVPVMAAVLAGLFILRGLGLGIPYLSPQLSPAATIMVGANGQPATMHYCHDGPAAPAPSR
ncbi:sulfite exporter TauE/SafE family protein [Hymenobacter sp. BT175]|uniref:sulfite exporter TauE/SafE family protein n=1 Tax=Hymenobacter translucens TaxID=2886507 RepID=UPI001D0E9AAA|nr:sulfite exporter TauE/SafE family protein [Hymenobacter translucens]MCC2547807.1 sulfite exporter TauE/SafE family protein [Hymenobacter translucens]